MVSLTRANHHGSCQGSAPTRGDDPYRHPGHGRTCRAGSRHGRRDDRGLIECEVVVNAGGIYAHEIGRLAGVHVPIIPMAHQYVITKDAGYRATCPPCATRASRLLPRRERRTGRRGLRTHPEPWGLGGIASDFNSQLLSEDWDRFADIMEAAALRVPSSRTRRW